MKKAILATTFDDVELTDEEIRQCAIIHTADGTVRLMPPSVLEKLRIAFWEAMATLRSE